MNDIPLTGSQRNKLTAVYSKAEYQVNLPAGLITFRIGVADGLAEAKLLSHIPMKSDWAILTPCNPRSQEATQEMNVFYHHELKDALIANRSRCVNATNHDPSGMWQDEPGFLIADADPLWIRELGLRFHQNAFVACRLGEAPRLVWLI